MKMMPLWSVLSCFWLIRAELEPARRLKWERQTYMDVSVTSGTPKSSILVAFSIINHPFWGTPIFGNTPCRQTMHTNKEPCPAPSLWWTTKLSFSHFETLQSRLLEFFFPPGSWLEKRRKPDMNGAAFGSVDRKARLEKG